MVKSKKSQQRPQAFYEQIEQFTERRLSLFFSLSLILTIILGFYLFELRISEGGDDSGYIMSAKNFKEGLAYPAYHGTGYAIFLSWMLAIFGFKVGLLKITSYLFILGHLYFFYRTFKGRIPATVLVMAMLISSVSAELLYFGSQTYTEAMYLFLQSAFFYLVIRHYSGIEDGWGLIRRHWWKVLLVGHLLFVMALTKNIGIVATAVLLFFLLTEKKYFLGGYTLLSFFLFRIPFDVYKRLRWDVHESALGEQFDSLLLKNFYNPGMGKEDFGGMVQRFLDNSEIYLSRLLMIGTGVREPGYSETSALITILLYALFGLALYHAVKKNRVMRFIGYYLGGSLLVTFVILQQHWGQIRLIIIYIPMILLFLPWGLLQAVNTRKMKWLQPVSLLLLIVLFFRLFGFSVNKAKANNEALMRNLRGNKYYGYTPDWVNFLKMSSWAAQHIPDSSLIGSRKPSMSFIYGEGRTFYGMYRFPTFPADTVLRQLEATQPEPIILNEMEIRASGIPAGLNTALKRNVESLIYIDDTLYSVMHAPEPEREYYARALDQAGVRYQTGYEGLKTGIERAERPSTAIIPDSLLSRLERSKVEYLIRGNLRLNPSQKTNRVINTVHRYMYFIELKYPGTFTQVFKVGEDNDEPAYLFKLNWDRIEQQRN